MRREGADALVAELEHKGNNPEKPIHLPSPSYFPFLIGVSIMLVGYGIVYNAQAWGLAVLVVGILGTVTSFIGWAQEPGEEEPPGEEH